MSGEKIETMLRDAGRADLLSSSVLIESFKQDVSDAQGALMRQVYGEVDAIDLIERHLILETGSYPANSTGIPIQGQIFQINTARTTSNMALAGIPARKNSFMLNCPLS